MPIRQKDIVAPFLNKLNWSHKPTNVEMSNKKKAGNQIILRINQVPNAASVYNLNKHVLLLGSSDLKFIKIVGISHINPIAVTLTAA